MRYAPAEFWDKAVAVRTELVEQYAEDPDVTLIDIGTPPEQCPSHNEVVVRIHVTEAWFAKHPGGCESVQEAVEGFPVCVVQDEE